MTRPQDAHVQITGGVKAIEQGTCARSSRDVTNISLLFPYKLKCNWGTCDTLHPSARVKENVGNLHSRTAHAQRNLVPRPGFALLDKGPVEETEDSMRPSTLV